MRRGKTLGVKLLWSIVLPMILLVLIVEAGGILVSMSVQIEDSTLLNDELVNTLGKNFEEMNGSIHSYLNLITMDKELQALLGRGQRGSLVYMEDNVDIKRLISDKVLLSDNVEAIYIYDADGFLRTFWHRRIGLGVDELYRTMPQGWCDPSGRINSFMDQGHLLYVRQINSIDNLRRLGYALVIYDTQAFSVQFDSLIQRKEYSLFLLDGNGVPIVRNYSSREIVNEYMNVGGGMKNGFLDLPSAGKTICSEYVSDVHSWKTVSIVSMGQTLRSAQMMIKIMIISGILALALGCLLSMMMVHRSIVQPVRRMTQVMRAADTGDYTKRLEIATGDELQVLAESMNGMLERTDNLVNQVLGDKILHRELQLSALQAQINPHLLHNTLECINWLAEFGRKEDIRTVTLSLSRLMQSLTEGARIVSLDEELEYTRCFLRIYEVLLEKRLSYTIEKNVSSDLQLPRLTIQPLVENAVIHGIKKSLRGGHIDIRISEAPQGVLISVLDDGAGMDSEVVEAFNRLAMQESEEESLLGVGLRNVISRVHLLYGREAKLICTSDPSWGTLIDLTLPYEKKEGQDRENGIDC